MAEPSAPLSFAEWWKAQTEGRFVWGAPQVYNAAERAWDARDAEIDRLAAAVREGEARGRARVLAVFEQIAQADLDQWGERPTREEQTTVTEAIAKAREALAAGEADGH